VRLNKKFVRGGVAAVLTAGLAFGATGCFDEGKAEKPSRAKEDSSRNSNYDKLVANQPAHTGPYSPTRTTKNFWIDTWMKDPKKLSYVYITQGEKTGYFVLEGLPVSYCTSLLPPQQKAPIDMGEYGGQTYVQAPSMDGTFSSGGDCVTKYGKDATTGAYVEFTVGQNQSYFLYDQPMNSIYPNAEPKGPTKVVDGKAVKR
jgi:hypothetical protein